MTGLLLAVGFTPEELQLGVRYWNARTYKQCPRNCSRSAQTFQRREAGNMQEWYERAKTKYRKQIKQVHPDHGGTEEEAARLNLAWARLRILFMRRGVVMKP